MNVPRVNKEVQVSTDAIAPVGDGVPQYAPAERLHRVAAEKHEESQKVNDRQVASGQSAPNVTTSPAYSPIVYAHAAVHAQAGVIAAMVAPNAGQSAAANKDNPEDIHAVEAAQGSTVDRYA